MDCRILVLLKSLGPLRLPDRCGVSKGLAGSDLSSSAGVLGSFSRGKSAVIQSRSYRSVVLAPNSASS